MTFPPLTEESLRSLYVNDLFSLLAKYKNELFAMERNKEDKSAIKAKQKEVELIQRVLIAKRVEFSVN